MYRATEAQSEEPSEVTGGTVEELSYLQSPSHGPVLTTSSTDVLDSLLQEQGRAHTIRDGILF